MNICGVLVHTQASMAEQIRTQLNEWPGVQVHAAEHARLVVTVENAQEHETAATLINFQRLDGVLSAALVYHYNDSQNDL